MEDVNVGITLDRTTALGLMDALDDDIRTAGVFDDETFRDGRTAHRIRAYDALAVALGMIGMHGQDIYDQAHDRAWMARWYENG